MGQRGPQAWSKTPLPIGSVQIRTHSHRVRTRMIKIDERPSRWMNYAKWWWERNRGTIPKGMRVVHRDGNVLNDDPENYVLCTAGDVAYLARIWDPTLNERNRLAVTAATAECNRLRGRINRARNFLHAYWYPVDLAGQTIHNRPYRSRAALYRAYGVPITTDVNGHASLAHSLGWQVNLASAVMLTVLADAGGTLPMSETCSAAHEFRALRRWPPNQIHHLTWASIACALRRRGYLMTAGRGRLARHSLTPLAIAARGPVCPVVAIVGSALSNPPFAMFAKANSPEGRKDDSLRSHKSQAASGHSY